MRSLLLCAPLLCAAAELESVEGTSTYALDTKLGTIKGNLLADYIVEFLGIRYAYAPVGKQRLGPSLIVDEPWSSTYDATQFGASCYQRDPEKHQIFNEMSEDCLFLNIWTPEGALKATQSSKETAEESADSQASELLPVMLFIHGGGFVDGGSAQAVFNGFNSLVKSGRRAIRASLNYRLGPLGFLQSADLPTADGDASLGGMFGVHDQTLAIQWVKDNIADYGGDPNRLTIYGESAGGLSVCLLLQSPKCPKFQNAIIESGACNFGWGPATKQFGLAFNNARCAGAGYANASGVCDLDKLRAEPSAETLTYSMLTETNSWGNSVDGYVINEVPLDFYQSSNAEINAERVIIGFNSMDGLAGWPYFSGAHPDTWPQFKQMINFYIRNPIYQEELLTKFYPEQDFINASVAWYSLVGDVCLSCPSWDLANELSSSERAQSVDVYMYYFRTDEAPFLAPHAGDLPYVFNNAQEVGIWSEPWSQNLSDSMVDAWTNFAVTNQPNVNTGDGGQIEWAEYSKNNGSVFILDDDVRSEAAFFDGFRHGVCPFWVNTIAFDTMKGICFNMYKVN